jgi:hypothetical protein
MSIAGMKLDENEYLADLETLDRYQSYSAEVGRLAALALATLGFLFSLGVHDGEVQDLGWSLLRHSRMFGSALVALTGAIGLALAHRYFSTDAFAALIRSIRLAKSANDESDDSLRNRVAELRHESQALRESLRRSGWLIAAASLSLVIGVLLSGWSLLLSLSSVP